MLSLGLMNKFEKLWATGRLNMLLQQKCFQNILHISVYTWRCFTFLLVPDITKVFAHVVLLFVHVVYLHLRWCLPHVFGVYFLFIWCLYLIYLVFTSHWQCLKVWLQNISGLNFLHAWRFVYILIFKELLMYFVQENSVKDITMLYLY